MQKNPGKPSYPLDEQARVREALRELLKKHGTKQAVADMLGVSRQSILKIVEREGGPGVELVRSLAAHVKMTESELLTGRKGDTTRSVEYLRRYPNAEIAAEFARREGVGEAAILDVSTADNRLPADAPPGEWLAMMRVREGELRRASSQLALDVSQKMKDEAASSAHIEQAKRAAKPKLSLAKRPKA